MEGQIDSKTEKLVQSDGGPLSLDSTTGQSSPVKVPQAVLPEEPKEVDAEMMADDGAKPLHPRDKFAKEFKEGLKPYSSMPIYKLVAKFVAECPAEENEAAM